MSLWGNVDSGTVNGTLTATNASATVTGFTNTATDNITVGDILVMADVPYRVKTVDSTSQVTLTKVYAGSTGNPATIRRNPPRHLSDVDANAIFGVDNAEASSGEDNVTEIAIVTSGSGYINAADADVSVTGGGGASADGDAVVTNGQVTSVTVTNVGSSYETVPTVAIDPPTAATFDGSDSSKASASGDEIVLTNAQVNALNENDPVTYSNGGGGDVEGLVNGTKYYIQGKTPSPGVRLKTTADGDAYIDITDVGTGSSHSLTGDTATAIAALGTGGQGITPGWVKRTAGTGGRAGRVHYETLVASGTITGDHENIRFPA